MFRFVLSNDNIESICFNAMINCTIWGGLDCLGTHWKIDTEPENQLFEKEQHLPNLYFWGSKC